MAQIAILSDIHANLSALEAVLDDIKAYSIDGIVLLGDNINYGMRPNEIINRLVNLSEKHQILANICGNHEKALMDGHDTHFSTDRGRQMLAYTKTQLLPTSQSYLRNKLSLSGMQELEIDGKSLLFVHGSLSDPFWGKMDDTEISNRAYAKYDYVISGHSHIPNMTEQFYHAPERTDYRNKKRTIFLNPGSVGQPRNHNPKAQYLLIDITREIFHFNSVEYDIQAEQNLYTAGEMDNFYRIRLKNGI